MRRAAGKAAAAIATGAVIAALGLTGAWAAAQQPKPQTMPFLTFPLDSKTEFTLINAVSFGDGVIYTGAKCPGQGCPPEQTLRNYDYSYRVKAGSKARAMADGEVAYVISQPNASVIWILHPGQDIVTAYAKLSSVSVQRQERVTRGQTIGATSQTFEFSAQAVNYGPKDAYERKDHNDTGSLWLNTKGAGGTSLPNCPVHAGDEHEPNADCIRWTNPRQPGSPESVLPRLHLPGILN